MKKVAELIIISIFIIVLVGCQIKTGDNISKDIPIESKESLSVDIIATNNSNSFRRMPITLKPKVKGEHNKELQYHWILKNNSNFEGFILPEKGPQKEIVNSGEPIELGIFAIVEWVKGTVIEFKVRLQVEDKETSAIIATHEIVIENNKGIYNIK